MRIAVSEPTRAPISEVREWPFVDVFEAHLFLDYYEATRPDPPKVSKTPPRRRS